MKKKAEPRFEQTEALSAATSAAVQPVQVEAVDGPGKGARAVLSGDLCVVGANAACDLVLADRSVSNRHATLELKPGAVRVTDVGSRNGTYFLNARIREASVPLGGTVRMGRTTLRFSSVKDKTPSSEREDLFGLVGASPAMRAVYALLEKLGPTETTVLVCGETGTGKDSAARALHALSPRSHGPFVVFDCGAISPELLEAQLFGHTRGAFTGATEAREGAIAQASGGTLFLAGIDDLPLPLQPKLLRVLEGREYQAVGGTSPVKASIRVVAETRKDLDAEVKAGRFRADLYFRLAVAIVTLPPLRERREDIPTLAKHFAREKSGVDVALGLETLAALQCAAWPGNVRELRNAVERAMALGQTDDGSAPVPKGYHAARAELLERFERDYLAALLAAHGGKVATAAREAGLSRVHFYELMKRHGLERK